MYGKTATGVALPPLMDAAGRLVSPAGKFTEAALAGRLFSAANQAAVATTAGLATTWTGLALANPVGSGRNYVLHEVGYALTVVGPAATAIGLMTSDLTGLVATIAPRSAFGSGGSSAAIVDNGATIATPVLERVFGVASTGAITTQMLIPFCVYPLEGGLILPPGRSVLTYTNAACTAALIFHFLWEELPL